MGILVSLIATALCAVVYVRMYKRDLPEPIGKGKAALPPLLGLFAPLLSTLLVVGIAFAVKTLVGVPLREAISSPLLRSLANAFLSAALPEELVKFLVFLIAAALVRPRNVYEYGMLCAGVGFGFTGLEDALYGGDGILTAATRIPFFGLHMIFQLVMGLHLGLAKYNKKNGLGGVGGHRFLAFFLPILWHTVFDAMTASNPAVGMDGGDAEALWIVLGLVVLLVSVALQFLLFVRFRKKSGEYCAMPLTDPS